jgi:hypothetical protein
MGATDHRQKPYMPGAVGNLYSGEPLLIGV